MGAVLTIQDLFKLILFLLGIGVLGYLIVIFKNLNKLISQANTLMKSNEKNIDIMIKQMPEITENINSITKTTDDALKELTPDINSLVHNISNISGKVSSITDAVDDTTNKFSETLDIVTDSVSETAYAFQHNVKNFNSYIQLVLDVIETIKNILKKK